MGLMTGTAGAYAKVVAAGAVTAGVAATTMVAAPDTTHSPRQAVADVGLSAITIPFLDIDQTVGPLTVIRQLLLTLGADANTVFGSTSSKAGTIYDLPGLYTNFQEAATRTISATRNPGESIDFGFVANLPNSSEWSVLNIANGAAEQVRGTTAHFTTLLGGTEGIGAALGGTLADYTTARELSVLGSGFSSGLHTTTGVVTGQLSAIPFDGLKAVGGGTLAKGGGGVEANLGSLEFGGGGGGELSGDAGLCLGSAAATCGGRAAYAGFAAPVDATLHTGPTSDETNVFSVNIPTKLSAQVANRQLSVTGTVGGTVSVGQVTLGRVIPVDIQIPGSTATTFSTNPTSTNPTSTNSLSSTVRNSLKAVPQKSAADSDATGGKHRAPFGTSVADIKASISNAVSGRHAAKESTESVD